MLWLVDRVELKLGEVYAHLAHGDWLEHPLAGLPLAVPRVRSLAGVAQAASGYLPARQLNEIGDRCMTAKG